LKFDFGQASPLLNRPLERACDIERSFGDLKTAFDVPPILDARARAYKVIKRRSMRAINHPTAPSASCRSDWPKILFADNTTLKRLRFQSPLHALMNL